jgi:rhodanese-related sulfurtransferase
MKKAFLALAIFGLLLSCKNETTTSTAETEVKLVPVEDVLNIVQMEDAQLIDVRTPEEFEEGHIANALNIDFFSDNFLQNMEKLDKEKPVVLYCKSGNRSNKSVQKLKDSGFSKIYDVDGGITEWKSKGFDVQMTP